MKSKMRNLLPIHRLIPLVSGLVLFGLFARGAVGKEIAVTLWQRPFASYKNHPPPDEKIQKEAKKYLGVRYKKGGSTKKGMDCSGFVRRIYESVFGVNLPHNASSQYSSSIFQSVSVEKLNAGDLIFFSSNKRTKRITHVGIYLSDGLFIHAAQKDGVRISSLDNPYWKPKIVAAKRLENDRGLSYMETFQSTAGLEFSLDEKSSFRLHYSAIEMRPFQLQLEPQDLADLRIDRYDAFEVEYVRELWNDLGSLHLSAFRADLPDNVVDAGQHPSLPGLISHATNEHSSSAYFEGIKMASHINPFQWLRITPSLGYFHYGTGVDDHDLPRRSLGLELQLGSLETGWSLSTAFQYYYQNSLMTKLFDSDADGDWNALDMSFIFRHQLTNHVQLSLTGQHVLKGIPDLEASFKSERRSEQSLFFTLDFTY